MPLKPRFNGGVENWFQPRLLDRRYARPGDLRRELARLKEAVNTQHVHPRLGGQTPARHRRGLRLRKLPASFVVPTERLPLAAGHVTFIRRVMTAGTVSGLSQSFWVRKKHSGLYLRMVMATSHGWMIGCLHGQALRRSPYQLRYNSLIAKPAAARGSDECSGQRCGGGQETLREFAMRCRIATGSIHIIGNLPPLLEPNLEIDASLLNGYRAAEISHPRGTSAFFNLGARDPVDRIKDPDRAGDPVGMTFSKSEAQVSERSD
jgi:hypothetical protein